MAPTVTLWRLRPGGYVGPGHVHPAVVDEVRNASGAARERGVVRDVFVARSGSGVAVVATHGPGLDADAVGAGLLAAAARVARSLGQHDAGDDPGRVGRAALDIHAEPPATIVCLLTSGAGRGSLNPLLFRAFCDPSVSPSLVDGPASAGFSVGGTDVSGAAQSFGLPADVFAFLRASAAGFAASRIVALADGTCTASASSGCDPVAVVRCGDAGPTLSEVLEAVSRASCPAPPGLDGPPLMPVPSTDDGASRAGAPPRLVALGFQVSAAGLVGPRDLLADRAFDAARDDAFRAWRASRAAVRPVAEPSLGAG